MLLALKHNIFGSNSLKILILFQVKIYAANGDPKLMISAGGTQDPSLRFQNPSAVVVLNQNTFIVKDDFALFAFDNTGNLINVAKGNFRKLYGE